MKRRLLAVILSLAMILPTTVLLNKNTLRADSTNDTSDLVSDGTDAVQIAINSANFPDSKFRSYIAVFDTQQPLNVFTEDEIDSITAIDCSNKGITSLKGIQYFTKLKELNCTSNSLTSVDLSGNPDLETLICTDNQLTKLNLSGMTKLTKLSCDINALTSLDVSMCTALKELDCGVNELTSLKLGSLPSLTYLYCASNNLPSIDLSGCAALEKLFCQSNKFSKLDITKNPKLMEVMCHDTGITELAIYGCPNLMDLISVETPVVSGKYASCSHYFPIKNCTYSMKFNKDVNLIKSAPSYKVSVTTDGNGTAQASVTSGPEGTEVTLTATPNSGYVFKAWQVIAGGVTITDNKFLIGQADVEIKAVFEKGGNTIVVTSEGNGMAYASVSSAAAGTTVTLTAIPNTGYMLKEWKVISGGVTITNNSFVMGDSPVEIKAVFGEPTFEDFIERMYVVALNRASEPDGKAFWMNKVTNEGFTGGRVAIGFLIEAPEFLNRDLSNDQFLDVLYKTFFDRAADADGKAFWLNHLTTDMTREQVVRGFIDSIEWCNLCAFYGVKSGSPNAKSEKASSNAVKFVSRLYTELLGRDPDNEGLQAWALRLTNLEVSGAIAARDFYNSPEFRNQNLDDTQFLTRLYKTFMDREPDSEGMNFWIRHMHFDMTRDDVLRCFAESDEFEVICKKYGIERGTIK